MSRSNPSTTAVTEQPVKKSRKLLDEEIARAAALANLELLKQELSGMERQACRWMENFKVGASTWRSWLLPTEDLGDLKPEQVDWLLKNIEWVKRQIG